MNSALSLALILLLCGCICSGANVKDVSTTLPALAEGQETPDAGPALKYDMAYKESDGEDPVLSIKNKNDFDWRTCYILIDDEYSEIVSEEYRADVTKDVPVGGSFDTVINERLVNQFGKQFTGRPSTFMLDCDQGAINGEI